VPTTRALVLVNLMNFILNKNNNKINVNKRKFESKSIEKYSKYSQILNFSLPKYKEYVIEEKNHICAKFCTQNKG
jgi:hypothetical protein